MQQATITEPISHPDLSAQPDMAEREAIRQAQNGDAAAFEFLYRAHSRRVFALCLRMIGNRADAEELAQETFLCVFRKIHTFRGDSAFSTWLHRLATNVVLMRLRKKSVSQTPLQDGALGEEGEEPQMEFGVTDLTLAGSIDRLLLNRAIEQLPAGYKHAFVLHDVLGYEHTEIATMSGYSVGNSKSQLHKARVRLRKLLRKKVAASRRRTDLKDLKSGGRVAPQVRRRKDKERADSFQISTVVKSLGFCNTDSLAGFSHSR